MQQHHLPHRHAGYLHVLTVEARAVLFHKAVPANPVPPSIAVRKRKIKMPVRYMNERFAEKFRWCLIEKV